MDFFLGLMLGIIVTFIIMFVAIIWFIEQAYWKGYDDAKAGAKDRREEW